MTALPLAKVGETYKGWEILEVIRGENGGFKYKARCTCGLEKITVHYDLKNKILEGCKKCAAEKRITCVNIGHRIGNFELIAKLHTAEKRNYLFKCLKCGIEVINDIHGKKKSPNCANCIHLNSNFSKIKIGSKFGSWTILEIFERKSRHSQKKATCKCDCGKISTVNTQALAHGKSSMCHTCANRALWKKIKETRGRISISKPSSKPTEYNNIYLNFCIQPRPMDDIIEHTGLSLHEVQDQLIDLQLDGRIEINKDGLWQTL